MKIITTEIEGVKIIEPDRFGDSRGWFSEVYSLERYRAAGIDAEFVQDNESFSSKGVIRGLHWQASPHTQAKLVRVTRGAVWDVAVDIRKGSKTYGKHVSVELSAENGRQLFIPRGFAHGFVVLEDNTLFSYKCDNYYSSDADRGMRFDDPALGIEWPKIDIPLTLSEKDMKQPMFAEIEPWEE
ncbi:MAG: dTDP-4-dehydrorhamnose 3,5-epimerase [Kiritimatiellae bacterium]|nr:dTDP-4-dehydrorhamnose 3,5-epimerase [Kiritimatiellia bacterium]